MLSENASHNTENPLFFSRALAYEKEPPVIEFCSSRGIATDWSHACYTRTSWRWRSICGIL